MFKQSPKSQEIHLWFTKIPLHRCVSLVGAVMLIHSCRTIQRIDCLTARRWNVMHLAGTGSSVSLIFILRRIFVTVIWLVCLGRRSVGRSLQPSPKESLLTWRRANLKRNKKRIDRPTDRPTDWPNERTEGFESWNKRTTDTLMMKM